MMIFVAIAIGLLTAHLFGHALDEWVMASDGAIVFGVIVGFLLGSGGSHMLMKHFFGG